MAPMTKRIRVRRNFQGQAIETNIFAFEAKVILGLKITYPDGLGVKIELNDPHGSTSRQIYTLWTWDRLQTN